MKVLGIETSCDDTAVAVLTTKKEVIFNKVISQAKEHSLYGGVVPEIASRSHLKYLDSLLDEVKSVIELDSIDLIAVTNGPGLIGGLIVGVMYAKALAASLNKPIVGVDHLLGHSLVIRLTSEIEYPYLTLLVSGGHTRFLIVKNVDSYEKIGDTLDDALGESFDKVAKMLGLDYPGGPIIEKLSLQGDGKRFKFPRPLHLRNDLNFSFSGLKTAVRYEIEKLSNLSNQDIADVAASFQETVCQILKIKLEKAMDFYLGTNLQKKQFVITGGVASNMKIRGVLESTCHQRGFEFHAPPLSLCMDNASMIAWAGLEKYMKGYVDNLDFKVYSSADV